MQSENECGFGDNTWDYALYVWTMMKHYIGNGAESYLYWNPVLEPVGRSTWGDPQNAMVTVDPASHRYTLNPDYYVMKSGLRRRATRRDSPRYEGHLGRGHTRVSKPGWFPRAQRVHPFHEECGRWLYPATEKRFPSAGATLGSTAS
jgi:glucosylceramidase